MEAVRGNAVGLFSCAVRQSISPPPGEGAAMRIAGWTFGSSQVRLLVLPAIAIAGCTTWMMLPGRSDAEGQSADAASPVLYAQNVTLVDHPTPTDTISTSPEQVAAPA